GVERDLCAARCIRAEHDHDEVRPALLDRLERLQPVHHGHVDVQRHGIRSQPIDAGERDAAVGRYADHLDGPVGCERRGDETASDDRVVDDQHAWFAHQSCSTKPTTPSFSASASLVIGLVAYSSTPAINAWKICAGSLSDVIITTRISSYAASARTCCTNVIPSMPGIVQSTRTTATRPTSASPDR